MLWSTLCEYKYEDISSDKSVKDTRKQARKHALEHDGNYTLASSQSGALLYACDEHHNCPKKRRVVYGDEMCIVQENQEDHSTASNLALK